MIQPVRVKSILCSVKFIMKMCCHNIGSYYDSGTLDGHFNIQGSKNFTVYETEDAFVMALHVLLL